MTRRRTVYGGGLCVQGKKASTEPAHNKCGIPCFIVWLTPINCGAREVLGLDSKFRISSMKRTLKKNCPKVFKFNSVFFWCKCRQCVQNCTGFPDKNDKSVNITAPSPQTWAGSLRTLKWWSTLLSHIQWIVLVYWAKRQRNLCFPVCDRSHTIAKFVLLQFDSIHFLRIGFCLFFCLFLFFLFVFAFYFLASVSVFPIGSSHRRFHLILVTFSSLCWAVVESPLPMLKLLLVV